MKSKYDCVVVGAGPAGLMAAKTLGESGQDVLLVDIKKDIPEVNPLLLHDADQRAEHARRYGADRG